MLCPTCRKRSARRACPALGRQICPACCGSKRLVEIACPPDCGYLAAAQAHPAASVRRQQERDLALLQVFLGGLNNGQQDLALNVLGFVASFANDPLLRLADADVADGVSSLASTFETAARGLIYEHRPRSLVAQRLVTELKAFLEQSRQTRGRTFEADAAAVLRRIGDAFAKGIPAGHGEAAASATAGVEAAGRIVRLLGNAAKAQAPASAIEAPGPSLIRP